MGKRIGITGGIGAGKSAVAEYLINAGETVINADAISREVVEPKSEGLCALVARFGNGICMEDGSLNRGALARIVFSSEAAREEINALLHPLIIERMEQQAAAFFNEHPGKTLYFEIPLLIEAGMQDTMDEVWLVAAADETRISRVMRRDGCTRESALQRIQSQMKQEEKLRYATHVLHNDGTISELYAQVDLLQRRTENGGTRERKTKP
ncbi:dephospho-CoA kinase [Christensenellaceae bacterium OttesenSCG-928-L17]|nr:dephospho-CoA kinase [Christensenellaceae bacterium OttesenSCG-928-L17]